jgi:peptide-methionine (R)-S-oxide reductase
VDRRFMAGLAMVLAAGIGGAAAEGEEAKTLKDMPKSEAEWKKKLTPEEYRVLRGKGTERPFTGKYYRSKEQGVYRCAACGQVLYRSDTKFESGTGWPSFWDAEPGSVRFLEDKSHGMRRTEVVCSRCGSHLGHVFDDGPGPTGKRHCINSVCLLLDPAGGKSHEAGPDPKPE